MGCGSGVEGWGAGVDVCGLLAVLPELEGLDAVALPVEGLAAVELLPEEALEEVFELLCADWVLSAAGLLSSCLSAASSFLSASVLSSFCSSFLSSSAGLTVSTTSSFSAVSSAAGLSPPQAARLPHSASASRSAVHFFIIFPSPPVYLCGPVLFDGIRRGFVPEIRGIF